MRQLSLACACSQKCSLGLDSIMWQEDLKIGQNYPLKIESVSLVFTCLNNWQLVIETKYVVQKSHFNTFLWLLCFQIRSNATTKLDIRGCLKSTKMMLLKVRVPNNHNQKKCHFPLWGRQVVSELIIFASSFSVKASIGNSLVMRYLCRPLK